MAECYITITRNGYDFGVLPDLVRNQLERYDESRFAKFLSSLENCDFKWQTKYGPTKADGEAEMMRAKTQLLERLNGVVLKVRGRRILPSDIEDRLEAALRLKDRAQDGKADGRQTNEPAVEDYRKMTVRVREHLNSIMGQRYSYLGDQIIRAFRDEAFRMAQVDQFRGRITVSDEDLNRNVWSRRAEMFSTMVRYLKDALPGDTVADRLSESLFRDVDGIRPDMLQLSDLAAGVDIMNFMDAVNRFRSGVIAADPKFIEKYAVQNGNGERVGRMKGVERGFRRAAEVLNSLGDPMWEERLADMGYAGKGVMDPFEGYEESPYARVLADYLGSEEGAESRAEVGRVLSGEGFSLDDTLGQVSRGSDTPLTEAFRCYVYLTHFDELLGTALGGYARIAGKMRNGFDYGDGKYSLALRGNVKVDWTQSANDDATKFTTPELNNLLNGLKVYQWEGSGSSTVSGRRLSVKSVSDAFSKVMQGLLDRRYKLNVPDYVPAEWREGLPKPMKADDIRNELRSRLVRFQNDPIGEARWILRQLFEVPEDPRFGSVPMIRLIDDSGSGDGRMLRSDIDALYTLHHSVFDSGNPMSVISIMERELGPFENSRRVIDNLAGVLLNDSHISRLVQKTDFDGRRTLRAKADYVTNYDIKQLVADMNGYVNGGMDIATRRRLQDGDDRTGTPGYGFRLGYDGDNTGRYVVTLNDGSRVEIATKPNSPFGIMYGDESSGSVFINMSPTESMERYWKVLDGDGVIERLRDVAVRAGDGFSLSSLSDPAQRALYATLKFVDDYLDMGFLKRPDSMLRMLQGYRRDYAQGDGKAGMPNYMMPFVKMAMRAAYANSKYIEADNEGVSLTEYLKRGDVLYRNFTERRKGRRSWRIGFSAANPERVTYNVVTGADGAVEGWLNATRMYNGADDATKAGLFDERVPTVTMSKNGANPYRTIGRLKRNSKEDLNTLKILDNALRDVMHGYSVEYRGQRKRFIDNSVDEFIVGSMINRFYLAMKDNRRVYIDPGSYADKKNAIILGLEWETLRNSLFDGANPKGREQLVGMFSERLFKAYGNVFENVREKLGRVLDRCGELGDERLRMAIADTIKSRPGKDADGKVVGSYDDSVFRALRLVSEGQLVAAAQDLGETVTRDLEYRRVPDGKGGHTLAGNELLRYYGSRLQDTERLDALLRRGEAELLDVMLRNGLRMFVIPDQGPGRDNVEYHRGRMQRPSGVEETSGDVFDAVEYFLNNLTAYYRPEGEIRAGKDETGLRKLLREDFYRNWVSDNGELVLAKQGGRNVLRSLDYVEGEEVRLNPFIEYWNLIDVFLSRGLDIFMGGAEYNNPVKDRTALNAAKLKTADDIMAESPALDEIQAATAAATLQGMRTWDDIGMYLDEWRRQERLPGGEKWGPLQDYLQGLYEDAMAKAVSETQIANDKRRGGECITPGYDVILNKLNGVRNRINIAVFDSIKAKANDVYGGSADVDVVEGGNWGLYTQWLDECVSFGANATGQISKPMVRGFDFKTGTSQYIKEAIRFLSNSYMRLTDHHNADGNDINGLDLFWKMTGRRWHNEGKTGDAEINLVKNRLNGLGDGEYVDNMLFGNRWLYYVGRNGVRRRIERLGRLDEDPERRTTYGRYYYTVEGDGTVRRGEGGDEGVRVVHVFHDRTDTDGNRIDGAPVHLRLSEKEFRGVVEDLERRDLNPHPIDSVYELHDALGGIWCVDRDGAWSEDNHHVLANFMNYTVIPTKRGAARGAAYDNPSQWTQEFFDQPLKDNVIHYLTPSSTIKKGGANINSTSALYRSSRMPFSYMPMDAGGIKVIMDAGKQINDDDDLRLSTQLIAILGNTGTMPAVVSELHRMIARKMLTRSAGIVAAVEEFTSALSEGERKAAADRLYEIIGNVYMKNVGNRRYESIASSLMEAIAPDFLKNGTHFDDTLNIPFSTPAFYNDFVRAVSGQLTNSAIRLRMPGDNMVMLPSYDAVMVYDLMVNGRMMQLLPENVRGLAMEEYRGELLSFLRSRPEWTGESGDRMRYRGAPDVRLDAADTDTLERIAAHLDLTGSFSGYFTADPDTAAANARLEEVYMARHAADSPLYGSVDYFVPGDVVEVVAPKHGSRPERVVETVSLDIANYRDFKDRYGSGAPKSYRYRISTRSARNLKPRMLRWRYEDEYGVERWTNVYELAPIKELMRRYKGDLKGLDEAARDPAYIKECNEALYRLDKERRFTLERGGAEYSVKGRVEMDEAETVHGNLHAGAFGIRKGETLFDVMAGGEERFRNRMQTNLRTPFSHDYDLAMLREDGEHLFLKFDEIPNEALQYEESWDGERSDPDGTVWVTDEGGRLFPVARWVDSDGGGAARLERGRLRLDPGVDSERFRVYTDGDGRKRMQERVDLVRKYRTQMNWESDGGKQMKRGIWLYKIASPETFARAYDGARGVDGKPVSPDDMLVRTARMIFRAGDYATMEASLIDGMSASARSSIARVMAETAREEITERRVRDMLNYQAGILEDYDGVDESEYLRDGEDPGEVMEVMAADGSTKGRRTFAHYYHTMKPNWLRRVAYEKWVSFQDSTKIISGRIPASGFQSFMNMRTVGWTGSDDAATYVSHFQIFLQGSDYDVDKANVTSQNYDSTGRLVGWNRNFDLSSTAVLNESKNLPLPDGLRLDARGYGSDSAKRELERDGYADITRQMEVMLNNGVIDRVTGEWIPDHDSVDANGRAVFVRNLAYALRAIKRAGGKYMYNSESASLSDRVDAVEALKRTLQLNEDWKVSDAREQAMLDNAIMATIWKVVGSIRNMGPSSMSTNVDLFVDASRTTPQAMEENTLSEWDAAAKYVKQNAAQCAKEGVSIAANGQKGMCNDYEFVTRMLKYGNEDERRRTMYNVRLRGVVGRADGRIEDTVFTHMPDLNTADADIAKAMRETYDPHMESGTSSVDELPVGASNSMMQLINVCTDDPKLQVLSKINGRPEMVPYYCSLISLGVTVRDAVAFMTTPYVDEVLRCLYTNIFSHDPAENRIDGAVKAAGGLLSSKRYLHGVAYKAKNPGVDAEAIEYEGGSGEERAKIEQTRIYMANRLNSKENMEIGAAIRRRLGYVLPDGEADMSRSLLEVRDLDELARQFIIASASTPGLGRRQDSRDLLRLSDIWGSRPKDQEVRLYIDAVDVAVAAMRNAAMRYSPDDVGKGVEMLLSDAATFETLTGVKNEQTTKTVGYLSLNQGVPSDDVAMASKLKGMERAIFDRESALGIRRSPLKAGKGVDTSDKYKAAMREIVDAAKANSPQYSEAEIRDRVGRADRLGIVKGFSILKAMEDVEYREAAIRYLDLIKATQNVLAEVYSSPHYSVMMDMLHALYRATEIVSAKSRMVHRLLAGRRYVGEDDVKGMRGWADRVMALDYLKGRRDFVLRNLASMGFTRDWDEASVSMMPLDLDYGQASFCRYVTDSLFPELKSNYGSNPFVRALKVTWRDGRKALKLDVDMLSPDSTEETLREYHSVLDGISALSGRKFGHNGDYSLSDVLFLYNLVEYGDRAERGSFTTAFRAVDLTGGVPGEYYGHIAARDRNWEYVPEYDEEDYKMNVAKTVKEGNERFAGTDEYIWVENAAGGKTLKRYDAKHNIYRFHDHTRRITEGVADRGTKARRRGNFIDWSPMVMPNYMRDRNIGDIIRPKVDVEANDFSRRSNSLRRIIVNSYVSGLAQFYVIC